jgi:DMSO/TMAO reductase YedYZ heme-binding membrane subunit
MARARNLLIALSLFALALSAAFASFEAWLPARELVLARGSGYAALAMLLAALSVSPLARVFPRTRATATPALRRLLGMTAAWLALAHAGASLWGGFARPLLALWTFPHLRAGALALLILGLLLLTSYGRVLAVFSSGTDPHASKLSPRTFRELHFLSYPSAWLVLLHLLSSPFAPRSLTLLLLSFVTLLGILRLPW